MKATMMLAALGVVAAAGAARADFGGAAAAPAPAYSPGCADGSCGGTGGAPEAGCEKYGTHPILRKLFWWRKDDGCGAGGCKARCAKPEAGPPPGYQQGPPGTLVFPTHPFNRGPRDFWMWEPGR